MTRRRAGWTGALIAVPGAAAAFAGLVGWAVQSEPAPAEHPVAAPVSNVRAGTDLTVSHAIVRQDQELAELQRRLHVLRGQLAQLTKSAAAAPNAGSAGSPGTGSTTGTTGQAPGTDPVGPAPVLGTGGTAPAPPAANPGPAPAPAPVATPSAAPPPPPPASAAPPPTQTTTGASGTKK